MQNPGCRKPSWSCPLLAPTSVSATDQLLANIHTKYSRRGDASQETHISANSQFIPSHTIVTLIQYRKSLKLASMLSLWCASLNKPWVQAHVSDVMTVENPGEKSLQSHSIASVGTRAIFPLQKSKQRDLFYSLAYIVSFCCTAHNLFSGGCLFSEIQMLHILTLKYMAC